MTAERKIIASVAPKALEQIIQFIESLAKDENKHVSDYYLRVFVEGGGCAGYQQSLAVEDKTKINHDDNIQMFDSLEVRVDPMSAMYLEGANVDYVERGVMGGAFVINNPNASGSCGCGNSFST